MTTALRTLLASLIDYAGLFPPAALPMEQALRNYDHYRRGEYAWALGRFVVPAARLHEVPDEFPVSVLVTDIASLPDRDTIEVKATSADEIERIARAAGSRTAYVEIAEIALLDAIAANGLRAKIRTGGVTAEAFPEAEAVGRFVAECMRRRLPFKATAGLHHPLRCVKPLTYERDAPRGTMHGFVNLFLAAALPERAAEILVDDDPRSFAFDDDGASWRGTRISNAELASMRECAISFGSCSFEEPIADLKELGWF
ncbi:MAG TPA: hypothetical protein VN605_12765 [Thermoanaerobaculia bacterium]|nr:hypothetical protein [Thermoanaerobaculia bacterium]